MALFTLEACGENIRFQTECAILGVVLRHQLFNVRQHQHAAARQARKDAVNAAFDAAAQSHVAQAHAMKRAWATTQDERLKPEADLRGITVAELSALILSKPDAFAERELNRQRIMLAIEAAQTPQELESMP